MRRSRAAFRRILALAGTLIGVASIAFLGWRLLTDAGILGGTSPSASASAPVSGAGEVFLEPRDTLGPDPFTATVALPDPNPSDAPTLSLPPVSVPPSPSASGGGTQVIQVIGGAVGLYGGSTNDRVCDKAQLIAFLEDSPVKAAAWAGVQGIAASEIRPFIEGLTPVRLTRDTRVTNHGFRNGVADARQSVLQAGTAVLVDRLGVPRARCFCGNPLAEPRPVQTGPTYVGDSWPAFDPAQVTAITPAAQPLAAIPVVDPVTGAVTDRPVGSDGTAVASPTPVPTPTPVAATPSPGPGAGEPVAREPAFPSDLTPFGAIDADSVDLQFGPQAWAVDLDPTTSWFSKGPHQPDTVTEYTWSLAAPTELGALVIVSNEANATPAFRAGFGFERVLVELLVAGSPVTAVEVSLAGDPDPNVLVRFPAGITADAVRMRFTGHESLDCGGVGEVMVLGPAWEADRDAASAAGLGWLFVP
jgi:hypothetical protein